MADAAMTRVCQSDTPMYGPRKLLACGYAAREQDILLDMLDRELDCSVPVVFCLPGDGDSPLAELLARDHLHHQGQDSKMPRAIILSGVSEKELHSIMAGWKTLEMGRQLWAALTPTSETWSLRQLITELQREHLEMQKMSKA